MSIATEITRLQGAKADIKTAIEAKGVTVPSSAKLDTYDTYVAQISGGGGTSYAPMIAGTITSISASDFTGITKIRDHAFEGCSSMTGTMDFTNITEIGGDAFANCTAFPFGNLSLPSVTSITSSKTGLFYKCNGLTSLTLPNTLTNLYTEHFVHDCKNLTSVTLPQNSRFKRIMLNAFSGTDLLTSITIPSNITTIDQQAFYYGGLTSITIPNSVTSLDYSVFNHCSNLVTATLGTGVTKLNYSLFQDCTSLTTVTINGNITEIAATVFKNCSSLTSLSLPASLTKFSGADIFNGCALLTEITFAGTMAQWNAITKSSNWNRGWSVTTIHCSDGDITL